jgi:hypothetical protein
LYTYAPRHYPSPNTLTGKYVIHNGQHHPLTWRSPTITAGSPSIIGGLFTYTQNYTVHSQWGIVVGGVFHTLSDLFSGSVRVYEFCNETPQPGTGTDPIPGDTRPLLLSDIMTIELDGVDIQPNDGGLFLRPGATSGTFLVFADPATGWFPVNNLELTITVELGPNVRRESAQVAGITFDAANFQLLLNQSAGPITE